MKREVLMSTTLWVFLTHAGFLLFCIFMVLAHL